VKQRQINRLVAVALFVFAFTLVEQAQQDVGIARDETVYMTSGTRYAEWWTGVFAGKTKLSQASITSFFGGTGPTDNNREHPPLMKTLSGLSERWLHQWLGMDRLTSYRLPAIVFNALLIALMFAWVGRVWGRGQGIVAALLTLFLPRAFFHAGLACFDGPIVTLWLATLYAYWRGFESRGWRIASGIIFGLALATKHNAVLLPFVVAPHYLAIRLSTWRRRPQSKPLPLSPLRRIGIFIVQNESLGWPLLLGPLTLIAVWPWLWFHPIEHIQAWLKFHMTHVHYNFEYLGTNWNAPKFPWHVALVTTLLTVPAATLSAAAVGAIVGVRSWVDYVRKRRSDTVADPHRRVGLLLCLSAAASMGPFFLGTTPIFGAEKHWAPAIPSLCVAAAIGVAYAARRLSVLFVRMSDKFAIAALSALAALVVASAAIETRQAQPYALSYYNAFAGGAAGGADLGMNRQFWGISARGALPFLRNAMRESSTGVPTTGHSVYSHDASPAWGWYQAMGLAPKNLPDAGGEGMGVDRSDFAFVVHEKHFLRHDYMIWKSYGTVQPVFVLRSDGVPIVSVYRRPVQK
jgi:hypothetical protein